jgi:hypothetical protein
LARQPLRDDDPARVGRYRLTARLGAGGMGVVYLGVIPDRDTGACGEVAVKVPFRSPALGTVITTLTSGSGGFTASGQSGPPGQQAVVRWTSATGTTWAMIKKIGIPPVRSG